MTVLLTGAAGFIGFHTALALLAAGERVIGVDNVNDYYEVSLKEARLDRLAYSDGDYTFHRIDVADYGAIDNLVDEKKEITKVVKWAAQAGGRASLPPPLSYTLTNIPLPLVLLEACRRLNRLEHFVYASSSSVYGANSKLPFSTEDRTDTPLSLYAATKKSAEMVAHCYAHIYGMPLTGLRFFTVYGPWGRPDMAAFIFISKILAGEPISVFNNGDMRRDFTYIDDIVSGVLSCVGTPPVDEDKAARLYNLGNNRSEPLMRFIAILEDALGHKAKIDFQPIQRGDVKETYADITAAARDFGFAPKTTIDEGLPKLVAWYREHYDI